MEPDTKNLINTTPTPPVAPGFIPPMNPVTPPPTPVPAPVIPLTPIISTKSHTGLWILALVLTALVFGGAGYYIGLISKEPPVVPVQQVPIVVTTVTQPPVIVSSTSTSTATSTITTISTTTSQ